MEKMKLVRKARIVTKKKLLIQKSKTFQNNTNSRVMS